MLKNFRLKTHRFHAVGISILCVALLILAPLFFATRGAALVRSLRAALTPASASAQTPDEVSRYSEIEGGSTPIVLQGGQFSLDLSAIDSRTLVFDASGK